MTLACGGTPVLFIVFMFSPVCLLASRCKTKKVGQKGDRKEGTAKERRKEDTKEDEQRYEGRKA
jgi:hypothetical protein